MHNLKTVLINPPRLDKGGSYSAALTIPLGICYLASYLKKNGYIVKIIDGLGDEINNRKRYNNDFNYIGVDIEKIITECEPYDIIGISINFSVQQKLFFELITKIKKTYPNKIMICGGNEATINYKHYLDLGINYVILGEGEKALLEIIKCIENKQNTSNVNGVAFYNENKLIITPKKYIENLDSLPFPARDMLPLENYWSAKKSHGPVTKKFTSIITSRGCPYNCSFCSSTLFWDRKWRKRSPINVVDEIEECINKYGITEFEFEDDNLTLDKKRAEEIFNTIINRDLKITWTTPNGVRSDHVDEDMLELMKTSGCKHLTFSPESGSKRVLNEIYNKNIDLNRIKMLVKKCNSLGIRTACFFVVGTPQETDNDRNETLDYIIDLTKIGVDEIGVFPCVPYPGTKIKEFYKPYNIKEELIIGDLPEWYPNGQVIKNYIKKVYLKFFVFKLIYQPQKMFRSVKNILLKKQELKIDRAMLSWLKFN